MEETPFTIYRKQTLKELPTLHLLGIITTLAHLTVGILWENISIPKTNYTILGFTYLGGYLILVAIAFTLIFTYFLLILKIEQNIPKHHRRFVLTLSILLLVGQTAIAIIMCIRANDYRVSSDSLNSQQMAAVMTITILDIILTFFSLPFYFYQTYINVRTVKLAPDDEQQQEEKKKNNDVANEAGSPLYIELQVRTEHKKMQQQQKVQPDSPQPPQNLTQSQPSNLNSLSQRCELQVIPPEVLTTNQLDLHKTNNTF